MVFFINGGDKERGSRFIACCGWVEKSKEEICAYKYVNENNCHSEIRALPRMKFTCDNTKSV